MCVPLLLWMMQGAARLPSVQDARSTEPHVRTLTVENGGLLFTDNQAGVSGVDCGYSIPLGRRTLWIFGDVFLLDPTDPAKQFVGSVSNCALVVPSGHGSAPLSRHRFLTDAKSGLARPVLPYEPGEDSKTRLWPQALWYDAASHKLITWYSRVRTTGGGPLDFRDEGHGVAVSNAVDLDRLVFKRVRNRSGEELWWKSEDGPIFGVAAIDGSRESGGTVYVVGSDSRNGDKGVFLARVRTTQLADSSAYEYFSGSAEAPRWSRDAGDCAAITGLSDVPGEMSVAWNPYVGGYLAVHSVGISQRIRLSAAPHPWGPYRMIGEIGAPKRAFSNGFCYAGKEHPELHEENGRVLYVTYVDSERYWLQLLRVTLDGGSAKHPTRAASPAR